MINSTVCIALICIFFLGNEHQESSQGKFFSWTSPLCTVRYRSCHFPWSLNLNFKSWMKCKSNSASLGHYRVDAWCLQAQTSEYLNPAKSDRWWTNARFRFHATLLLTDFPSRSTSQTPTSDLLHKERSLAHTQTNHNISKTCDWDLFILKLVISTWFRWVWSPFCFY